MNIIPQKVARIVAVGGVALAAMGSTVAYAGTTSTLLSNGTLSFTAINGRYLGTTGTKFFSSASYHKTGGSAVSVTLGLDTQTAEYNSPAKTVKAGQTVSHNFGGKSVSTVPQCYAIGFMRSGGKLYETPSVRDLC
ncbi:hypothetical protein [Streptomyces sp. NPDC045470]|uniref:hypothetical protein n=1 Tax=Streptomyces sp. NPDC045470 TaxID=3155469 RepID=UPI0033CC0B81